jgi:hypothetical protein
MLGYILHFGVNTPFWDEWEMVSLFQAKDNGTLSFHDLWAQHNEHRIFFPNIVLMLSAYATHWNVKFELLLNFAFSLVTALMLYLFVLSKIKQRYLGLTAALLIGTWFYSTVQFENWLWGWQVEWFMCVAGAVTSIYLLDRFSTKGAKHRRLLFGGAVVTAIVSTFSLGSGVVIWPVGFGLLLLYRQPKKSVGLWTLAAVLSAAAYYYHYHKPAGDPSTTLFLHQRVNFLKYIFSYFGRPVSSQADVAMLVGATLLLLLIPLVYAVWLQRAALSKFMPWLSLMALSLIAGGLTAVSRLGFGVIQGSASRYTAFSLLYVIGVTGLICALLDTWKIKRNRYKGLIVAGLLVVSGPLLFSSYANGLAGMRTESTSLKLIAACTRIANPTDGCLLLTYPQADVERARLHYIKVKHWSGY